MIGFAVIRLTAGEEPRNAYVCGQARNRAPSGMSSTRRARCSGAWRPSRPVCSRASTSRPTRRIIDTGDHVVIVNAANGQAHRPTRKNRRFTGTTAATRAACARSAPRSSARRQPMRLVEEAVRGMLPKTKLGDAMYRKLKVYAGADHPHAAQQPADARGRITWQRHRVLRNRPPQDVDRPRVPPPRHGRHHRQRTARSNSTSRPRRCGRVIQPAARCSPRTPSSSTCSRRSPAAA